MSSKALTAEVLDVTQAYIEYGFSMEKVAEATGLSMQDVQEIISQPQAKAYINDVYLDTGYRNRAKIGALVDRIIESKVAEAEESEEWSKMDLADLLKLAHKIRMDELKIDSPNTQVNIANFGDSNYASLVEKLLNGRSK